MPAGVNAFVIVTVECPAVALLRTDSVEPTPVVNDPFSVSAPCSTSRPLFTSVIVGDAQRMLAKVAGPFDFIFQDGDKLQYEAMLDRLGMSGLLDARTDDIEQRLKRFSTLLDESLDGTATTPSPR